MSKRLRKGHNFEKVHTGFTDADLADFKPKSVFNEKWVILKSLGLRGEATCYEVCDKQAKKFGVLYVEISKKGMNTVSHQVEFSHKQYSIGNSHRFTQVVDCNLINNHVYYMVLRNRPGPHFSDLLKIAPPMLSPATVAYIAYDLISLVEVLTCSGYVLRNFDSQQWKMNPKSRQFYLTDITDIVVISDKRYCPINPLHFESADSIDLHWRTEDLTYAPINYIVHGTHHRMSELDSMESMLYVIYELAYSHLPWKNSKSSQKTLELKKAFMEELPEVAIKSETHHEEWLYIALQNTLIYIKEAQVDQERLEKGPVRDGAWCPNGARAGAQISAVKYREILDDFHKVIVSGRPAWSFYWRDTLLDWERSMPLTDKTKERLIQLGDRDEAWEVIKETDRLKAKRTHYTIMQEHMEIEMAQNAAAIKGYLDGTQDKEEVVEKPEPKRTRGRARKAKEVVKEEEAPVKMEEEGVAKKEEPANEQQGSTSARASRLQRRQQQAQSGNEKKKKNQKKKEKKTKKKVVEKPEEPEKPEKKQIGTGEADCPIKIEDYDSYDDEPEATMVAVQHKAEDVEMKEEEFEVKQEPMDDDDHRLSDYQLANPYLC